MKPLKLTRAAIAVAMLAGAASSFAASYYVVVPVPNRVANAGDIAVSLAGLTLPQGVVGRAYAGFDFNTLLSVTGDPSYSGYGVHWSVVSGSLPAGLTLGSDGKLSGTPSGVSNSSIQVMAAYKTKAGEQAYQVVVTDISIVLAADSAMPAGVQGAQYSYDLKNRLTVSGDPAYTPSAVSWSIAGGALPAGLQLNANGTITGVPDAEGTYPFTIKASYQTRTGQQGYQVVVGAITVTLTGTTLPAMTAGAAIPAYDLKQKLAIAGDAAYAGDGTGVTWNVTTGSLPAGLTLGQDGRITGTPTAVGTTNFAVTAAYKNKASLPASYSTSVAANILSTGNTRTWSDGTLATSCQGYLSPSAPYVYAGATGDGIYRVNLGGTPTDVYCNQTTHGGGWTLLVKQAQGDGTTLQGDTTYWENGTTLNDTASSLNMNDGNLMSAAYSRMSATQYMLQAANESTVQTYSRAASTPQFAFGDATRTFYIDPNGTAASLTWFIHTSTYPDGSPITVARFGANIVESTDGSLVVCAARWGWAANQDSGASYVGSFDACGGLGAYGGSYGSTFMNSSKNAWQPATLYLWAK